MITTEKKLEAARSMREMLSEPEMWVKGRYAETLHGGRVAHCLGGAVLAVTHQNTDHLREAINRDLAAKVGTPIIPLWNDAPERTHSDVIQVLDELVQEYEAA